VGDRTPGGVELTSPDHPFRRLDDQRLPPSRHLIDSKECGRRVETDPQFRTLLRTTGGPDSDMGHAESVFGDVHWLRLGPGCGRPGRVHDAIDWQCVPRNLRVSLNEGTPTTRDEVTRSST
jgi:hypothetical protein